MKILLDTNIIIHRETKDPSKEDIGTLFWWLDKLSFQKCIHRITRDEIENNKNLKARKALLLKLDSYYQLPTEAPINEVVSNLSETFDYTENDKNDTILINELFSNRVDFLITEDKKIHEKSRHLGLDDRVFTIQSFLEKVTAENPELIDYKIPTVKKEYFGNVDLNDDFFDTFKEDYLGFEEWFNSKAQEKLYVGYSNDKISALLYLKIEDESEPYYDIRPQFLPKKRLKVGTFKVKLNGFKIGERFLKIVFDNALHFSVDEIYVTIFDKREEAIRLTELLEDFGFSYFGTKKSESGIEKVFVRDFSKKVDIENPKITCPFMSKKARKFFVPIWPAYHTDLFPDSILVTESPENFVDNEPFRNAISKVYVSRSVNRDLKKGDIIIFYRTGGYRVGVITTLGIVENVCTNIKSKEHLAKLCRKRSVFSDKKIDEFWNYRSSLKPFVVNFLYAYSFPQRINLKTLIDLGVIRDVWSVPRGFEQISDESFNKIIRETKSNESIIVD